MAKGNLFGSEYVYLDMSKTIILSSLLALLALPAFAQNPVASGGGCGPSPSQFDVRADKNRHPVASPDAGKALVFVFEDIERGPTMRIGVDGKWIGANKGKSYFFFSVDPGDHQVCTNWQSGTFKGTAKRFGSAMTLKAEAGKVYYLRIQVYERSEHDHNVKLEPVETAEGQFLTAASAFSTYHAKE
ncbi:MAG: hypothetical protein NVS9B14_13770 [Candidatus Acidiferrum sp.]